MERFLEVSYLKEDQLSKAPLKSFSLHKNEINIMRKDQKRFVEKELIDFKIN